MPVFPRLGQLQSKTSHKILWSLEDHYLGLESNGLQKITRSWSKEVNSNRFFSSDLEKQWPILNPTSSILKVPSTWVQITRDQLKMAAVRRCMTLTSLTQLCAKIDACHAAENYRTSRRTLALQKMKTPASSRWHHENTALSWSLSSAVVIHHRLNATYWTAMTTIVIVLWASIGKWWVVGRHVALMSSAIANQCHPCDIHTSAKRHLAVTARNRPLDRPSQLVTSSGVVKSSASTTVPKANPVSAVSSICTQQQVRWCRGRIDDVFCLILFFFVFSWWHTTATELRAATHTQQQQVSFTITRWLVIHYGGQSCGANDKDGVSVHFNDGALAAPPC